MREIKFRAWDKTSNQMLTGDLFNPIYWEDLSILDYILMDAKLPNYDYRGREAYELMQYTGLKDKNGVEIYESDRCAMSSYLTSEVRYLEFAGAWYVGNRRLTKKLASQIEVTGNKYEN